MDRLRYYAPKVSIREKEVAWYRQNGKYPCRIATDSDGYEYVIGDAAWNNKARQGCVGFIEERMESDIHPTTGGE